MRAARRQNMEINLGQEGNLAPRSRRTSGAPAGGDEAANVADLGRAPDVQWSSPSARCMICCNLALRALEYFLEGRIFIDTAPRSVVFTEGFDDEPALAALDGTVHDIAHGNSCIRLQPEGKFHFWMMTLCMNQSASSTAAAFDMPLAFMRSSAS